MTNNGWIRHIVVLLASAVALSGSLSSNGWAAPPTAATLLDLPYGSGTGEVGTLEAHELDPSSPPMSPAMFQVMADGAIWVLDTVNSRVLQFRDGKEVRNIQVGGVVSRPWIFGATSQAVFVLDQSSRDDMPAGLMLRIDLATAVESKLPLDMPDGPRFIPLRAAPLGSAERQLLVYGTTWPDGSTATMVIGTDGGTVSVQEDAAGALTHMPGADGSVWRLRTLDERRERDLPAVIERYDTHRGSWHGSAATLPKRADLFAQRQVATVQALGVDAHGVSVLLMAEGSPLALKFVRVGPSGEVMGTYTFGDLGLSQKPIMSYVNAECFQVRGDGSLLIQYPTPERYRILKISF